MAQSIVHRVRSLRDNYRDIPDDKIVDLPETPGFGRWRRYFDPGSAKHPAKMNQNLLRWILARYTKEGETVLDPMAGTFSTVVQAALMGRNAVGVEYEEWMTKLAEGTLERLRKHPSLVPIGEAMAVRGDARELSSILAGADVVVTSPPHSDTLQAYNVSTEVAERRRQRTYDAETRAIVKGQKWGHAKDIEARRVQIDGTGYDAVVTSPPYAGPYAEEHSKSKGGKVVGSVDGSRRDYSGDPENIGHRKYGNVDAVITSPPHGPDVAPHGEARPNDREPMRLHDSYDAVVTSPPHADTNLTQDTNIAPGGMDPKKVGRTKYDAVITSPPYAEANRGAGIAKEGYTNPQTGDQNKNDRELPGRSDRPLSDDSENLSNLVYGDIDAIVTSPPYEDRHPLRSQLDEEFVSKLSDASKATSHEFNSPAELEYLRRVQEGLKTTEGNIGREKQETYLAAMARVYRECWKVLRPGGLVVIVVKNFVRDGKPVRLDKDTAKLLRWAGLEEMDHLYRRLNAKSFWIRNFEKKFQTNHLGEPLPTTNFEDILVFRKPEAHDGRVA